MIKLSQITLSNIKGFLQGHFRQFVEDYPGVVGDYMYEQVQYRLGIMDEQCLLNKKCPCNCSVPSKQFEDRRCENECYGDMLSEEDWKQFKEDNKITKESISYNLYKRKDLIWP